MKRPSMEAMLGWNYPLNMTLLIDIFAGTYVWDKVARWSTISVHFQKKGGLGTLSFV